MIESSDSPERGHLSWRWHAVVFLALLSFASLLLWGVYRPLMRQRARTFMERGDAFLERGKFLQNNADTGIVERRESLEQGILAIYAAIKSYDDLINQGWPEDPDHPVFRKIRELTGGLGPIIERMREDSLHLLETSDQLQNGDYLIASMNRLASQGLPRMERIASGLVSGTSLKSVNSDIGYLHYAVIPDFIESARKIQAFFHEESSFDMGMEAYFSAIAFARDWTAPRLRMAELYHARQWPEFTMLECLKVIKLDPESADADRAREILASYDGHHPEADYYIGLSRLLQGDRADGTSRLRRFVARHPLIPNAPKAYNLLNHMDRGHEVFVKTYLRDEIWI